MTFAREGYPFIGTATVVTIAVVALATNRRSFVLWTIAAALAIVTLWVAYFFRDPERTGPRGDDVLIAPADGRVLPIVEVDEPTFVGGRAVRISIFMNVFNVHVNRYPIDGVVRYLHYNPGKFINAAHDKASLENEQMSIGIETPRSKVLVRQIAGLVARRIVTYSKNGDSAKQGVRFGIIRFGSRVDIFAPVGTKVDVKPGDHTQAGVTVIATLAR